MLRSVPAGLLLCLLPALYVLFRVKTVFVQQGRITFGLLEQADKLLGGGKQVRRKVIEAEVGRPLELSFHVEEERFEYRHVAVYPHELIRRLCPCQRSGLESPLGFDVLHHVRGVAFGGVGHHQYLVFQIFQFFVHKVNEFNCDTIRLIAARK